MSHFYGSMQGSRGEATRQGTKQSGMSAHIRGWSVGVEVELTHRTDMGIAQDEIEVFATNGSNGRGKRTLIARITEGPAHSININTDVK